MAWVPLLPPFYRWEDVSSENLTDLPPAYIIRWRLEPQQSFMQTCEGSCEWEIRSVSIQLFVFSSSLCPPESLLDCFFHCSGCLLPGSLCCLFFSSNKIVPKVLPLPSSYLTSLSGRVFTHTIWVSFQACVCISRQLFPLAWGTFPPGHLAGI